MTGKAFSMIVLCPFCSAVQTQCTPTGGNTERPNNGDITLCFSCGDFAVFKAGQLVKPSRKQAAEIAIDPQLRKLQYMWTIIKPIADAERANHLKAAR